MLCRRPLAIYRAGTISARCLGCPRRCAPRATVSCGSSSVKWAEKLLRTNLLSAHRRAGSTACSAASRHRTVAGDAAALSDRGDVGRWPSFKRPQFSAHCPLCPWEATHWQSPHADRLSWSWLREPSARWSPECTLSRLQPPLGCKLTSCWGSGGLSVAATTCRCNNART